MLKSSICYKNAIQGILPLQSNEITNFKNVCKELVQVHAPKVVFYRRGNGREIKTQCRGSL
jgi:hypothetical protein